MWRLTGLLGRALPRLLGPHLRGVTPKTNSSDVPQATSSTLLVPLPNLDRSGHHGPSTSRGPKSHGWKNVFQWMSARVSPNTLWDAISWGTLAVLALQLARQIHFQASLPAGPRRAERCSWRSPLDRFLSSPWWHPHSSLRRHVLPGPDGPVPRCIGLREPRLGQEELSAQFRNFSLPSSLRTTGLQEPPEEGPSKFDFLYDSSSFEPKTKPAQPQPTCEKKEQDKSKPLPLEEAVMSIQQLFQLSVSIAFNFLGIENMRNGDYTAAFSYFQKAADRGYSKAQYNMGLCHEHGRGTPRNLNKAILYYQLAASQGHSLAQYRYARCLLQDPASSQDPERQRAVSMLKQAADSGLREAQAFLGVLFTKEPHLDEQKAVKYLWLAASNGDSQSRYHLGICYEKGLGVQRNLGEAVRCYQQSAALGNKPAQERLRTLFSTETTAPGPSHPAAPKSFSSPSLCSLNTLLEGASGLPHASSTGNLGLLCRSGHFGSSHGASSRALPSLERSLVRLGFC
ncbi:death ligand signal enhancer [Marmota monax]|uniref:DAP3-binding cell death enhancer 1 n=1 Tax=Marmota monax TaxID=9995 RepID=A0A834QH33_MARMO|nr:death ligand signal enhancer [Marmota monax]XP_046316301.1 death ligand signal enhancer [Marmota monax]KAF7478180.1 death ligand signal enhancer [Marmota monax]KAI6056688.1 DELE1 [Marmota monax]KAI6070477.1 DELE1 [Marmota monax]